MPYQRVHQKGVDQKDKTELDFFCLSAIFGHNVTHVLRQSLMLFSVFKQGTRLSKSSTTSRHTFPTAISHLFSMKVSFLMIYNDESSSLFRTTQARSKSLTLRYDISALFSLMKREKCIVNNNEWKIPNDNITCDSHLEETDYTGN